jgi:hypothetical protein
MLIRQRLSLKRETRNSGFREWENPGLQEWGESRIPGMGESRNRCHDVYQIFFKYLKLARQIAACSAMQGTTIT